LAQILQGLPGQLLRENRIASLEQPPRLRDEGMHGRIELIKLELDEVQPDCRVADEGFAGPRSRDIDWLNP
jgi:hypothetical protein